MKAEILITGGSVDIPGIVNAPYSTVLYLENTKHKILIDPGSFVVHSALEEKLVERGLKTSDITDILLTHFHLDHAYNTMFFENSTIYLHKAYKTKKFEKFGMIVGKLYITVLKSWKKVKELKGGEKLFESIEVIHTPWHAKEHVSFMIETENMGRLFLPGDICFTRLDYYEMYKGYRNDKVAKFVLEKSKEADLIIFTHDRPLKPFS